VPEGVGIIGSVIEKARSEVVADCAADERFAARIAARAGYVPNTMLVVPLRRAGEVVGALSVLDRRDGGSYDPEDVRRAELFAELVVATLDAGATVVP